MTIYIPLTSLKRALSLEDDLSLMSKVMPKKDGTGSSCSPGPGSMPRSNGTSSRPLQVLQWNSSLFILQWGSVPRGSFFFPSLPERLEERREDLSVARWGWIGWVEKGRWSSLPDIRCHLETCLRKVVCCLPHVQRRAPGGSVKPQ